MGDLSELAKEYKGSGFRIIGLSADAMPENPDMVLSSKEMFESSGGNFTNIIASQSVIKTMLQGVNTVPTTKFYDSEGRLITVVHGAKSKQKWIDIIETVMNEKA